LYITVQPELKNTTMGLYKPEKIIMRFGRKD